MYTRKSVNRSINILARKCVLDVINNGKKISEVYTSRFPTDVEVDKSKFTIKVSPPFTWICSKENESDMNVIIFVWENKYPHNPYFNGYMFGYTEEAIKTFYENNKFKNFYLDRENNGAFIEKIKQDPKFQKWLADHSLS